MTDHANARASTRTRAKSASRVSRGTSLLSLSPRHAPPGASTTAAATTGPASGPRPTSSTPASVRPSPTSRASARARRRQASRMATASFSGGLLLGQTRRLALLAPQIEQLRAAHLRMLEHLDVGDRRAVDRERALHAHAFADLAHRERLLESRAAHVDDVAAELLLPLFVAFDDTHRHLDGVAGTKVGPVGLELGSLELLDQAHERAPFTR